jgi:hypothetical protein
MENVNKCYFCDKSAIVKFSNHTLVCEEHWNLVYKIEVPNYIDVTQIPNFKKLKLEKIISKV